MVSSPYPRQSIAAVLAKTYQEYPELKKLPSSASENAWDISNLPVRRPLTLRKGTQLGNTFRNPQKPYNLEACLAYMRGELVKPCTRCTKNLSPLVECVMLVEYFDGACTCCHYNDNGKRCSLRGRRPKPVEDRMKISQADDDLYVPDADSDTPPASPIHPSRTTMVQGSSNPRIPTGPSLASRIGHEAKVEFGIKGAANSSLQVSKTRQPAYRESEYDGTQYQSSSSIALENGQSYRDSAYRRAANIPRPYPNDYQDSREPLYHENEYHEHHARRSEYSSSLSRRDIRDSLPSGRDYYSRSLSRSPPPLASRIQQRYEPTHRAHDEYDDPHHYSPPRISRNDRDFSHQDRHCDTRESAGHGLLLDRRITQKPNSSTESHEKRRNRDRPSCPEIERVPNDRQASISGKRDVTAAFGTSESMPPPKKKVQFAQGTGAVATAKGNSTETPSKEVPTGPRSMTEIRQLEAPTGRRQSSVGGTSPIPPSHPLKDLCMGKSVASLPLVPVIATNSDSFSQSVGVEGVSVVQPNDSSATNTQVASETRKNTPPVTTSQGLAAKGSTSKQPQDSAGATIETLQKKQNKQQSTPAPNGISGVKTTQSSIEKSPDTNHVAESEKPAQKQKKTPSERSADNAVLPKKELKQRETQTSGGLGNATAAPIVGNILEKGVTPVAATQTQFHVQKKATRPSDISSAKTIEPAAGNTVREHIAALPNTTMEVTTNVITKESPKTLKELSSKSNEETRPSWPNEAISKHLEQKYNDQQTQTETSVPAQHNTKCVSEGKSEDEMYKQLQTKYQEAQKNLEGVTAEIKTLVKKHDLMMKHRADGHEFELKALQDCKIRELNELRAEHAELIEAHTQELETLKKSYEDQQTHSETAYTNQQTQFKPAVLKEYTDQHIQTDDMQPAAILPPQLGKHENLLAFAKGMSKEERNGLIADVYLWISVLHEAGL